eukprot:2135179-Amphidinium_carterae.2
MEKEHAGEVAEIRSPSRLAGTALFARSPTRASNLLVTFASAQEHRKMGQAGRSCLLLLQH